VKKILVIIFAVAFLLTGCYFNDDVKTNQVGVQLSRNEILRCVPPGVYTDWGFFADLREVSRATLTFTVEDPEVATSDNQLVGVRITVQARRKDDCDSIKNLLTNWSSLVEDENVVNTVSATAREAIKNGTRTFDLNGLLNDRNMLAVKITEQLEGDSDKYSVQIINVTIENIALDPKYANLLQEKALITAETDKEKNRQNLINQRASNDILEQEQREKILTQRLQAERAQTSVDVEIASREGQKIKAQNQVYIDNQYAFELERLRLLREIFGEKSVVYFIPEGVPLYTIFGVPGGTILPLPASTVTDTVKGAP
jgi:hypothetical protein